ncbi:MAG: O-antigen ligase family protein [Candidatus Diapherotrites archaeon]|nr:O-antigen ligase family protein [Candidatus Diapherotrites archaeon]
MSVAAISTILGTAGGTLSFFLDPKMALTLIFMIYLTRNMKAAKNTFWVLSAIIIIFAGLSLASGGIFEGGGIEFIDRLENRNTLGINLLPLMPLAFAMLLITNKETKPFEGIPKKAFLLLAVLAVFVVIFVTGSRGSIIGVAAMLPMLFYYFPKQKIWPVIAIILLVSAPFFYWKVEDVVSRVQGLGALAGETGNSQFTGAHSIEERKNMLFDALSIFLANPFMGAGYDTSRYLLGLKGYYKNLEKTGELVNYQDAHNIYAEVLAETGIIGFIFYAMIIAFSFWDIGRAEKNFTEKGENDGATMAKCLRVSLVGMLVLGFAGNEPFYLIFIILVALGIILRQVSIDLNKEKQYELGSAGHF